MNNQLRFNQRLIALGLAMGLLCPSAMRADESQPMNVLLIIADDLRNEMGCYGSQLARTPHLDALATAGVCFDRAYCQYPLCNPSRSSMLTGRRPLTTGVIGNRTWFGADHPDFVSLPKHFQQQGYVTLQSGKIFHGGIDDTLSWNEGGRQRIYGEGARPLPSGRKWSPKKHSGKKSTGSQLRRDKKQLTKSQYSDRWIVLEGDDVTGGDHRVADQAIAMLREHRDEPFFLACGFHKPHSPLAAPMPFFDLFDPDEIPLPPDFQPRPTVPEGFPAGSIRPLNADVFVRREATPEAAREMIRGYLASSAWMDWNAGRVLAELDALGLREKTIVVFWGDHGYQLGEKGKWGKAGSLWEQGARVPLIIHDPRAASNGSVCLRIVETIDIYPTLCELCGLPLAAELEGRSLAPLLEDPSTQWNHPAYTIWCEGGEHVTGVVVRTERWRYADFYDRGAGAMLIDLENDPHELTNLVEEPQHSAVVEQLSALVRSYVAGHSPQDEQTP